jgi:DNA-directed RNA polymerase subunit RPC12/RpoP
MNGFSGWLRDLGAKLRACLQRFMAGRYGTDKLNMWILGAGVALCLIAGFVRVQPLNFIITLVSEILLIWTIFRSLSRNTYKRYRENRRFLMILEQIKDREHRHYECPRCKQPVRVPRGKGKIAITCPKCKEKFIKKT